MKTQKIAIDGLTVRIDTDVGPVGAEVTGIDLSVALSSGLIDLLRQVWQTCHVLFFRDQNLTPTQQADFARHFGELDIYPFMRSVQDNAHVIPIVKEKDATLNFGGAWHTDTSYLEKPPKATALYALEVPDKGGDTLFADCSGAYDDLSHGLKHTLRQLTAVYSAKLVHGAGGIYTQAMSKENLAYGTTAAMDDAFTEAEVEHPLIRRHIDTGRLSIYCNRYHTYRIKGWSRDESVPLITYLAEHMTKDKYVTRFTWRKGSLALWDNRCLLHNAMNDYQGHRRHMNRVIVCGERPLGPPEQSRQHRLAMA